MAGNITIFSVFGTSAAGEFKKSVEQMTFTRKLAFK
jgi:hypothetical protein